MQPLVINSKYRFSKIILIIALMPDFRERIILKLIAANKVETKHLFQALNINMNS